MACTIDMSALRGCERGRRDIPPLGSNPSRTVSLALALALALAIAAPAAAERDRAHASPAARTIPAALYGVILQPLSRSSFLLN